MMLMWRADSLATQVCLPNLVVQHTARVLVLSFWIMYIAKDQRHHLKTVLISGGGNITVATARIQVWFVINFHLRHHNSRIKTMRLFFLTLGRNTIAFKIG